MSMDDWADPPRRVKEGFVYHIRLREGARLYAYVDEFWWIQDSGQVLPRTTDVEYHKEWYGDFQKTIVGDNYRQALAGGSEMNFYETKYPIPAGPHKGKWAVIDAADVEERLD